ncbi:MAG: ORF6N domain-containing protein [Candidatus Omnitrophota bacterium]
MKDMIPQEIVEQKIFVIRGCKVMVDRDLAELYGVETKYLNRQVKRNKLRFPLEFSFRLNTKEKNELVTICHRFKSMKHSSSLPYVFTEHGVTMLASVLNSQRAIKISIIIVKAFVKLRQILTTQNDLVYKFKELEQRVGRHDADIQDILIAIRQLLEPPKIKEKRIIGFGKE